MFNLPGCVAPYFRKLGLGWPQYLGGSSPSPAVLIDTAHVSSFGQILLQSALGAPTKILLHHNDVRRDVIRRRRFVVLELGQGDIPLPTFNTDWKDLKTSLPSAN